MHILVDPAATAPLVGCSASFLGLMAAVAVIHPRSVSFVAVYVATQLWYSQARAERSLSLLTSAGSPSSPWGSQRCSLRGA